MFGDANDEAVRQAIRRPPPTPKAEPKFNAWALVTSIPRAVGEAGGQVLASLSEVMAGYGDVMARMETGESMQARELDMQSDFADSLRARGREFKPDPETAHAAEQILYGFARGATKVVGGAMLGGPAGVVAMGGEEAMTVADDLKQQGVTDPNVRAKAGLVQGAGLALAALPVVGQSLKATAGLYAVGGPGGFMATQAATRKILADAGYDTLAASYDPFDPVGLAVASLLPAAFAAYGIRAQRNAPSPELVDAALVSHAVEQRAASNPQPWSMRSADMHEQALARAEEQLARGEPVQVADIAAPEVSERPRALADAVQQLREEEAALTPKQAAPEAPQGKPRDLRAELIEGRKSASVLSKLLDCLA